MTVFPSTDISAAAVPGKKILVADDDPVTLQALALKLKSRGYQVVTATDGSQAISTTRKEKPDLMLLDVQFPAEVGGVAWNAFSLTEWLRRMDDCKNLPVIVISAADRKEYKQRASAVGAAGFLPKPINSDEMLALIDLALCAKPVSKPAASSKPDTIKTEPVISTDNLVSQSGRPAGEVTHLDLGTL